MTSLDGPREDDYKVGCQVEGHRSRYQQGCQQISSAQDVEDSKRSQCASASKVKGDIPELHPQVNRNGSNAHARI